MVQALVEQSLAAHDMEGERADSWHDNNNRVAGGVIQRRTHSIIRLGVSDGMPRMWKPDEVQR